MLMGVLTWLLSTALIGQSATDTAALKAIPVDVEIVVHVRSVAGTRDDLLAMIKAMSPNLAEQAGPVLEQALNPMLEQLGPKLADAPILLGVKLPKPDADQTEPAFIAAIPGEFDAIVAGIAGEERTNLKKLDGGLVSFVGAQGETVYAASRDGLVLFGTNEAMIRSGASASSNGVSTRLNKELSEKLLGGDVGVYVDIATLQTRFADEIAAARDQFMAALDQAAGQVGEGQMEQAKEMYGKMFDAFPSIDAFAMNIDLDKAALDLTGLVSVKADSTAAGTLKSAEPAANEMLGKLPSGALAYFASSTEPDVMDGLLQWNMNNLLGPAAQGQAEAKLLIDKMKDAGRLDSFGMMSFDNGMHFSSMTIAEHPEKLAESMKGWMSATEKSPFIQNVEVKENVATHRGFSLSQATVSFDLEKMAGDQAAGNPAAVAVLKGMLGDGSMTTFYGSDGTHAVSISAKTVDEAKARIDAVLDGNGGIGQTPGFQAARKRLPDKTNILMLGSAQGMVKGMARMIGIATGGEAAALPADLPKEPAFLGGSLSLSPAGYSFDLVVPSEVGPVLEKGLAPIIQAVQGQINQ